MPDTFKLWCLPQVNVTVAAGGTRQVHGYLNLAGLVAQSCLALCNPMDCGLPAPLSMGFPRQEYWRGLPFPPLQGIFPTQGLNPRLWHLLHFRWILHHCATWEAFILSYKLPNHLGLILLLFLLTTSVTPSLFYSITEAQRTHQVESCPWKLGECGGQK